MMHTELQDRRERAQAELQQRLGRANSTNIVESLWTGLSTLRKLLLTRLHHDVETQIGVDAILAPLTASETKREIRHAAGEIEIYSLMVVLAEAGRSGYAQDDIAWFRDWLMRLRWGDEMHALVADRMRLYDQRNDSERRRLFASLVEQALPEATQAPLIIYRLFPRAVRLATALAFGDLLRAGEIRNEQISYLPAIGDCHDCHGRPLDNGDVCRNCGNPLWKIRWLNETD